MIAFPRPFRPLGVPKLLRSSPVRFYHPKSHSIMSSQQQQQQQQPQKQRPTPAKKEKRPQLTHFLCLPLVNSMSLPQLEASFATFKADIPPASHGQNQTQPQPQPLIPDAAIRPVGTLHLTLGVMSLPSKERLDEAIRFLQSLDLVTMVREAETLARARAQRKATQVSTRDVQGSYQLEIKSNEVHGVDKEHVPSPFSVSLESLHALPRARAATVLHAAPVDSTSRLYPFCEMLRDRFLDAGFLQGEFKKDDTPQKQQQQEGNNGVDDPSETRSVVGDGAPVEPSLPEEMPIDAAQDVAKKSDYPVTSTQSKPASSKPKPRPLLLHATVVNTIYIKGRSRGAAGGKMSKNNRYSFDARDILLRYRNYYLDSQRMMPRSLAVTAEDSDQAIQREDNIDRTVDSGNTSAPKPFIWARDFPIESVCICEMGAKKLDPDGDENGLNARLREKYTVVAERSLGF